MNRAYTELRVCDGADNTQANQVRCFLSPGALASAGQVSYIQMEHMGRPRSFIMARVYKLSSHGVKWNQFHSMIYLICLKCTFLQSPRPSHPTCSIISYNSFRCSHQTPMPRSCLPHRSANRVSYLILNARLLNPAHAFASLRTPIRKYIYPNPEKAPRRSSRCETLHGLGHLG